MIVVGGARSSIGHPSPVRRGQSHTETLHEPYKREAGDDSSVIVLGVKKPTEVGWDSRLHHEREVQDEGEGDGGREDHGLRQITRKRFHTVRPLRVSCRPALCGTGLSHR